MTATGGTEATLEPPRGILLTAEEWPAYVESLIRDKRHLDAQLGADLAAYLSWARNEDGKAARTLDTYERDLARGIVMFNDLPRNEWRREHIRAAIAAFPEGSRPRVWAAWSDFWNWMYNEDRIDRNPMRGIKRPPKPKRKLIVTFTPAEQAAIVRATLQSHLPARDRVAVLLFLNCGLRKNEARHVQVRDIDLRTKAVEVRRGKGGDERLAYFGAELEHALIEYLYTPLPRLDREPLPSDYILFPTRVCGEYEERVEQITWLNPAVPMSEGALHRWWAKRLEQAGLEHKKLHTTRHTYATEMLDATGDLLAVKDSLGHASLASTELYVHNQRARMRTAVQALDAARAAR